MLRAVTSIFAYKRTRTTGQLGSLSQAEIGIRLRRAMADQHSRSLRSQTSYHVIHTRLRSQILNEMLIVLVFRPTH